MSVKGSKRGIEDALSDLTGRQSKKRQLGFSSHLKYGTGSKRDRIAVWRCRQCGYLDEGSEAPEICPACINEQAGFQMVAGNL